MTKIKICGLSRLKDIEIMNEVHPDYAGFVFASSRRQVGEDTAVKLREKLNPSIQTVGVFVNEDIKKIVRLCRESTIDIIQLHGDEDEDYIETLKEQICNPVMKAVRVRTEEDIDSAVKLSCEYLLLDTYKKGQYGGSGDTFDWNIISELSKPYFLAGGINSSNVETAINLVNPYAVDISSGVETDGFKDRDKIIDFVTKVRSVK